MNITTASPDRNQKTAGMADENQALSVQWKASVENLLEATRTISPEQNANFKHSTLANKNDSHRLATNNDVSKNYDKIVKEATTKLRAISLFDKFQGGLSIMLGSVKKLLQG